MHARSPGSTAASASSRSGRGSGDNVQHVPIWERLAPAPSGEARKAPPMPPKVLQAVAVKTFAPPTLGSLGSLGSSAGQEQGERLRGPCLYVRARLSVHCQGLAEQAGACMLRCCP